MSKPAASLDPAHTWRQACDALALDGARSLTAWTRIERAYAEPCRHYHTIDHIAALLELRLQHAARFAAPAIADVAIVMHDVVYDPTCNDNEAKSAEWAHTTLSELGLGDAHAAQVCHMIEMSRHDAASLAGVDPASDLAHFLDLDLSILAAEPAAYAAYAHAIRQEYRAYSDTAYRAGRASVLAGFLRRPVIYCSTYFGALWEARARANLQAEAAQLRAG